MKLSSTILFSSLIMITMGACTQKENATSGTALQDTTAIPDSVLVPVLVAKEYVDNYASHAGYVDPTREEAAQGKKRKPDTRCIWFSKERLQAILSQLDKEKGDGIRFYLATYNNTYPARRAKGPRQPERDYWGYNTLLMVSTKPDTSAVWGKIHKDYYTTLDGNGLKGKKNSGFIVGLEPENKGELCPPPADNCDQIGATLLINQ